MECLEDYRVADQRLYSILDLRPPKSHNWLDMIVSNDRTYVNEVVSTLKKGLKQFGVQFEDFVKGTYGIYDTLARELSEGSLSLDVPVDNPTCLGFWLKQYPSNPKSVLEMLSGDCVERAFAINHVARSVGLESVGADTEYRLASYFTQHSSSALRIPGSEEMVIIDTSNSDSPINPKTRVNGFSWEYKEQKQLGHETRKPISGKFLKRVHQNGLAYGAFITTPQPHELPGELQGKLCLTIDIKPEVELPMPFLSVLMWIDNLNDYIELLRNTPDRDRNSGFLEEQMKDGMYNGQGFSFMDNGNGTSDEKPLDDKEPYVSTWLEVAPLVQEMFLNLDHLKGPFNDFCIDSIVGRVESEIKR